MPNKNNIYFIHTELTQLLTIYRDVQRSFPCEDPVAFSAILKGEGFLLIGKILANAVSF